MFIVLFKIFPLTSIDGFSFVHTFNNLLSFKLNLFLPQIKNIYKYEYKIYHKAHKNLTFTLEDNFNVRESIMTISICGGADRAT